MTLTTDRYLCPNCDSLCRKSKDPDMVRCTYCKEEFIKPEVI